MTVTTRFAPSPTGFLHIGGARTALFNWLFARHNNGRFLLRIEDTDLKRSTKEAIDAILTGMDWLGLTPDEPPILQSAQAARHTQVALEMLKSGKAFKCYVTPEELAANRERGQALLLEIRIRESEGEDVAALKKEANALLAAFRSPYRDGKKPNHPEDPFVVRLRAPDSDSILLRDKVQGDVSVSSSEIDDLILLRADGTPTYMLAVVVDDHDMGITQVIRGDDHLTNTFRQIPIYAGMGWDIPDFAHIPLIHGPDGAKLSKRHGALGIEAYKDLGYLPEGIKNYLLRLGWSHGDEEFITESQAIDWFSLEAVNKGASRMDFEKLDHINGAHIKQSAPDRISRLVIDEIAKSRDLSDDSRHRIEIAMSELKNRGQTIPEIAKGCDFLVINRPIDINAKARKKLKSPATEILVDLRNSLNGVSDWTDDVLSRLLSDFCAERNLGMGQVGPQLRTALTGGLPAPDLHLVLAWLGRDEAIGRIDDILSLTDLNEQE